jgi:hypothetical protein
MGFQFETFAENTVMIPRAIQRLDQIQRVTLIIIGELDLPDFHAKRFILKKFRMHRKW